MKYSLLISVRAQKEIAEAFLWYAKESRTAAERLIGFVDDKLSIIQHVGRNVIPSLQRGRISNPTYAYITLFRVITLYFINGT